MTARREARRSRTPNEDADDEDKHATDNDLEGGLQERGIHIARADPGDHGQLDCDDGEGDRGRDIEVGNEIRQRVAEAAARSSRRTLCPAPRVRRGR